MMVDKLWVRHREIYTNMERKWVLPQSKNKLSSHPNFTSWLGDHNLSSLKIRICEMDSIALPLGALVRVSHTHQVLCEKVSLNWEAPSRY